MSFVDTNILDGLFSTVGYYVTDMSPIMIFIGGLVIFSLSVIVFKRIIAGGGSSSDSSGVVGSHASTESSGGASGWSFKSIDRSAVLGSAFFSLSDDVKDDYHKWEVAQQKKIRENIDNDAEGDDSE